MDAGLLARALQRAHESSRRATTVVLPDEQWRCMRAAIGEVSAREQCGILLGHCAEGRIVVDKVVSTRNFSRRSNAFVMSLDHMAQVIERNRDMEILGIFHTHNGTVAPSLTDLHSMTAMRCVWLIAGRQRLAAYRVVEGAVESLLVDRG